MLPTFSSQWAGFSTRHQQIMQMATLKHLSGKFKKEIEQMQGDLDEHLKHGSMDKFATEMFSAKLIPSNVHKEANFNDMIGNLRSGFSLVLTIKDLETHCCTFLNVLEKMDCGMCDKFATNLEKSWVQIFEANAPKTASLTKLGKRYPTPSQVDDKQSSESEYREYFRHRQKHKYSKKKYSKPVHVSSSLKAPERQMIPRTEDNGYLYPDAAEPTNSGDDGKKVWTALQQTRVSTGCLPPAQIALMENYAHTETPSHGHRSSLSHVFYSDGIPGDPVLNRALLQNLPIRSSKQQRSSSSIPSPLAGQAGQKMQAVSPYSNPEPLSSEHSCLPNKSNSDSSKAQVPNSLVRGESDEKGLPYSRRRSSSIPSRFRFPPFTSSQSESKSEFEGRTEMVANGSSATVSTVVSNEKLMELLSRLELQQGSSIGNKTQNCSNCEQLNNKLQEKSCRIAFLEGRLEEKDKQLKDMKEMISQLLPKK